MSHRPGSAGHRFPQHPAWFGGGNGRFGFYRGSGFYFPHSHSFLSPFFFNYFLLSQYGFCNPAWFGYPFLTDPFFGGCSPWLGAPLSYESEPSPETDASGYEQNYGAGGEQPETSAPPADETGNGGEAGTTSTAANEANEGSTPGDQSIVVQTADGQVQSYRWRGDQTVISNGHSLRGNPTDWNPQP